MSEDDPRVIGFDSTEEAFAYMAQREADAIAGTLPEQWDITWGDHVIRVVSSLAIFGRIFTEEEYLADFPDQSEEGLEEAAYELEHVREAHTRGYRWGKWYSEVEPTGEYGSAHVISLWRISAEDFQRASLLGWQPWKELIQSVIEESGTALTNREREHDGSAE